MALLPALPDICHFATVSLLNESVTQLEDYL